MEIINVALSPSFHHSFLGSNRIGNELANEKAKKGSRGCEDLNLGRSSALLGFV